MLYTSDKTGRGPLSSDWIEEYSEACRGKSQPTPEGKSVMCAYKLCKVEFRYWGMQSKIERFIHDTALRKTMLKAHSQVSVMIISGCVCLQEKDGEPKRNHAFKNARYLLFKRKSWPFLGPYY